MRRMIRMLRALMREERETQVNREVDDRSTLISAFIDDCALTHPIH